MLIVEIGLYVPPSGLFKENDTPKNKLKKTARVKKKLFFFHQNIKLSIAKNKVRIYRLVWLIVVIMSLSSFPTVFSTHSTTNKGWFKKMRQRKTGERTHQDFYLWTSRTLLLCSLARRQKKCAEGISKKIMLIIDSAAMGSNPILFFRCCPRCWL